MKLSPTIQILMAIAHDYSMIISIFKVQTQISQAQNYDEQNHRAVILVRSVLLNKSRLFRGTHNSRM